MRAAVVAAAMTLVGCTTALDVSGAAWTKPAVTQEQVTLDETECARTTSDVGQSADPIVGGVADAVRFALRERTRERVYRDCMASRGYQRRGDG